MRLCNFMLLVGFVAFSTGSQKILEIGNHDARPAALDMHNEGGAGAASITLVDVLSADGDFSVLIRLLQRSRMIPTLNKLHNATIFAPTDEAFQSTADAEMLELLRDLDCVEEANAVLPDNLQYRLRERLFYHMLNYRIDLNNTQEHTQLETLLYPTTHEEHGRPGHPYPSDPANTLLGGEGQKVVLKVENASHMLLGVDEAGNGGAPVLLTKGGQARNGQVAGLGSILSPPKSVLHQIKTRMNDSEASLSVFHNLMTPEIQKILHEQPHITLFAPRDEAFDVLEELEWSYLRSGFAADDILTIAQNHQSAYMNANHESERIGYLKRLLDAQNVSVLTGDEVQVVQTKGEVTINSSYVLTSDILASNGVVHIIDSLLLPYGSLALTPEKNLIALNCTKFVSLFRNAQLSYLLQSSPHNTENKGAYTILAATDDVLERGMELPWTSLPPEGSSELQDTLRYHIIDGAYSHSDLKDGHLLKTMLKTPLLGDLQQRMAVSVSKEKKNKKSGSDDKLDISFGNVNVIASPVKAGNSIIYIISRMIEPPSTPINVALDEGLSTFVAAVYAAGLDKGDFSYLPATTFLAPTNAAFDYLGLAMSYFLLSSARAELAQLLKYHALKDIVYTAALPYDDQNFGTLEGSDIYLSKSENASTSIRVRGPRSGGIAVNGDTRDAKLIGNDLLTNTGALHIIDQVELPPTINITSEKLMRGAKASTFADLLRRTNMSWIADGSLSVVAPDNRTFRADQSYTILCPTDKAFNKINLTYYLNDMSALLSLVYLHIIPTNAAPEPKLLEGRPIVLQDEQVYSTLFSKSTNGSSAYGDLAFRQAGEADWLVGIKGARYTNAHHDAARIISYGRNTPRFLGDADNLDGKSLVLGGGVLLIDGVLEPYYPGWFQRWGYILVIVLVSLAGTAMLASGIYYLWWRKNKRHEYEAVRQDNEED